MPSISQLIALSGRRIARMYPMIGKRQKLRRKARSISNFPASMIENQMPAAMPRIVRPKMTRASSRRRGELTAGRAFFGLSSPWTAWCHVLSDGTRFTIDPWMSVFRGAGLKWETLR